jgi:acyl carrier protein
VKRNLADNQLSKSLFLFGERAGFDLPTPDPGFAPALHKVTCKWRFNQLTVQWRAFSVTSQPGESGMQETRDAIRQYIVTNLIRNPKYKLGDTDKLISGGVIDSFSLVELSLFLEEKFGVRPDDTELNADNMDTVQMIADYVESHRQ